MKNRLAWLTKRELLLAILILSACIFVLFWEIFLLGYVQIPADMLGNDPSLKDGMPGFERVNNGLLSDHIYAFFVWHTLARRSIIQSGQIPLWNPYIMAGQPLVANAQPALFYPPNLLLFLFSVGRVANFRLIFNLLVAGIFSFLFVRRLGVSRAGSLLAMVSFAFSGAIMVGPGHAYAGTLVWLPMMLWACESIVQGDRLYFWAPVCGLGIGLSILAGHPETAFHNLLILGLYFLARLFQVQATWSGRLKVSLALSVALVLGISIGAIQWVTFASFLRGSATLSRSRSYGAKDIFYTNEWLPNVSTLVTLIFPNFFGNPTDGTYFWPFFNYQNYLEQSMYFGLAPFALAFGALFGKRGWRSPVPVLGILGIASLALALRLPLVEAINSASLMSLANNTRLKWQFSFFGAILAGFGLDDLLLYLNSPDRSGPRRVYRAAAVIFGIGLGILFSILALKLFVEPFYQSALPPPVNHLATQIFSWKQPHTLISIGVLLLVPTFVWLAKRRVKWLAALPWLLILVTAIELLVIDRGYNTTVPSTLIPQTSKLVVQLRKDKNLFRVLTTPGIFGPNVAALFGFYDVGGFDLPVDRRYADLVIAQGGRAPHHADWSTNWPLLNWMNVKYFIVGNPIERTGVEQVMARPGYFVYKNLQVLPRAYLVYEYDVISDSQARVQQMVSGNYDFANRVILDQPLPPEEAAQIHPPQGSSPADPNAVKIESFGYDRVAMQVDAPASALFVMSDINTRDWQAELDGQPTTIYYANHAFRGVFIPAGSHRLVFTYQPKAFQVGSILTILGIVACLVIGSTALLFKRKHLKEA